ncbi:FAD-binding oxidoreductase [Flavisphingomonas formosensis]|uniref:FAD-binding oxidoreductase n=1 Tax=Flavisphingomonas formosensis TaxID=861534 RepID=UPI0012FC5580|nr:FAD-binding oxidoreductase [Sphingomonas formosensis]
MTLDDLRGIVGPAHLAEAGAIEPRYLVDETGGPRAAPACMVRPADTREVSAVLAWCNERRQPVVVQGGRTGMARGALPLDGEVVLSLERLRAIEDIDATAGTMTVGAGVVLQAAQEAAEAAGWRLAVDIGARGSCTLGGMIATNAGGNQVLRYGMMREHVLGLEAVLADGTIVSSMNVMLKNNAGYDLKQLFIGSEGTLGVVTRAVMRLRPPAAGVQTAICALVDYADALALFQRLERSLPSALTGFELMWRDYLDHAAVHTGMAPPFDRAYPLYVLVEIEGVEEEGVAEVLGDALAAHVIQDAIVARSERERLRFWAFRDAVGAIVNAMAVVEPFDVSIPMARIGGVVAALRDQLLAEVPGCSPLFFGHIGDGNLHLALGLPEEALRPIAEAIVYDAVADAGGSISAEHGIGLLKRQWLGHSRTSAEIGLMRRLRGMMDPNHILNRHRVVEG